MSLILFGLGPSRSFRTLWALEEAGLKYDYVEMTMASVEDGGSQSKEYLALNPQGKVPTLRDGDFVLTESLAILNYIDTLAGGKFIPAADPKARAKYDELTSFIVTDLEQSLWTTGKHKFAIPAEYRVKEVLATALWEFEKAQKACKELFPIKDYVLGDTFGFADVLLAQTIHWADRFKMPVDKDYLAYRDSMFQRPACQAAMGVIPQPA